MNYLLMFQAPVGAGHRTISSSNLTHPSSVSVSFALFGRELSHLRSVLSNNLQPNAGGAYFRLFRDDRNPQFRCAKVASIVESCGQYLRAGSPLVWVGREPLGRGSGPELLERLRNFSFGCEHHPLAGRNITYLRARWWGACCGGDSMPVDGLRIVIDEILGGA